MDLRNYDDQGSANHYKGFRIDLQHQMEAIWGTYSLMTFCEMSAFCYRMRAGKKIGNEISQEIKKAEWFEKRAEYLRSRLIKGPCTPGVQEDAWTFKSELEKGFLDMLSETPEADNSKDAEV